MGAVIAVFGRAGPSVERAKWRCEDLDFKREAGGGVGAVLRSAIATRTGAERAQHVNLGKEGDVIPGTNGARFHEVLPGVAGEASTHENVEDIMNIRLRLF